MRVSTKELFKDCYGKYALAAVNVWDMEQVHGLFSAAQKADSPFIVQITPIAWNYGHREMLISMISAAARIYPKTVFAIHLDHGNSEYARKSIESGDFNSVMIDASHEPFENNISITRDVVELAHANNITVEAELGVLSGVEDDLDIDVSKSRYTRPREVEEFARRTGCDSLAVAVGTSHGAYKFSGGQGLQFELLSEIQKKLPEFPLVLHGGSAVNRDEILRINAAGGQLGTDSKGVPDEEIVRAIQYGVCKINIATDARLIWTRVNREFFMDSPEKFDPIIPGKRFMEAFEAFNLKKFELLGSTGKAKTIKNRL